MPTTTKVRRRLETQLARAREMVRQSGVFTRADPSAAPALRTRTAAVTALRGRFPDASEREIVSALINANHHGGIAARRLRVQYEERHPVSHDPRARRDEIPSRPTLYGAISLNIGGVTDEQMSKLFERAKIVLKDSVTRHRHRACVTIQCGVRRWLARRDAARRVSFFSARIVQRRWRAHRAALHRERRRLVVLLRAQDASSTRIQAVWRGVVGRAHALKMYETACATRLQACWRAREARIVVQRLREARAATRIRRFALVFLARVEARRRRRAIVRIQGLFRGAIDRRIARARREVEAAVVLQRYERRRVAMNVLRRHRRLRAAIRIAAFRRGVVARRRCRRERLIATPVWQIGFETTDSYSPLRRNVLSHIRGLLSVHDGLRIKDDAVLTIQRAARVWLERVRNRTRESLLRGATRAQARWRCRRERRRYVDLRNACVDVQRAWRARRQLVRSAVRIQSLVRAHSSRVRRRRRRGARQQNSVVTTRYVTPWGSHVRLEQVVWSENVSRGHIDTSLSSSTSLFDRVQALLSSVITPSKSSPNEDDRNDDDDDDVSARQSCRQYVSPWGSRYRLMVVLSDVIRSRAIVRIQRVVREHLSTRRLRARAIQACARGYLTRRDAWRRYRTLTRAAVRVQSQYRGYAVRLSLYNELLRTYRDARRRRSTCERHLAAIAIQAAYRGTLTRRKLLFAGHTDRAALETVASGVSERLCRY